jgi:hypothetical protein
VSDNTTFIVDEGDLRKYRTETPNIVYEMGLTPHAGWLYGHIKRVAGDSGVCFKGIRTLAKIAKMSVGKASAAKSELENYGLIAVKEGDRTKGEADEIRVVNMWSRNFRYFDSESVQPQSRRPEKEHREPCSNNEHPPCSSYERACGACSYDEQPQQTCSYYEHKKEPVVVPIERPPNGGPKNPTASSAPKGSRRKIKKLTDDEAERRFQDLCRSTPFGRELREMAEQLAAENKTGEVAIGRVWREIGESYVRAREREDLSDEEWAYGFGESLSRSKPSIGYVLACAKGYRARRKASRSSTDHGGAARPRHSGEEVRDGADRPGHSRYTEGYEFLFEGQLD